MERESTSENIDTEIPKPTGTTSITDTAMHISDTVDKSDDMFTTAADTQSKQTQSTPAVCDNQPEITEVKSEAKFTKPTTGPAADTEHTSTVLSVDQLESTEMKSETEPSDPTTGPAAEPALSAELTDSSVGMMRAMTMDETELYEREDIECVHRDHAVQHTVTLAHDSQLSVEPTGVFLILTVYKSQYCKIRNEIKPFFPAGKAKKRE